MPLPQKPTGAFVTNGWYLELPGLVSPHFETLSGIARRTNSVEVVDAGTNIAYNFSAQIMRFGQITLTRTLDGSSDDRAMDALVASCMQGGLKSAGTLIKRHFGRIVFSIAFDGLLFTEEVHPDYNTVGEDKLLMSYTAMVDSWVKI